MLFDSPSRLEIYGTDDYAICEGTLNRFGTGNITFGKREPLVMAPLSPFAGEIQDFVSAIAEDRRPEVNGEDALVNVRELVALIP